MNPPGPAHSLVFLHLLHIWHLSSCGWKSRSIFSQRGQLRDSYTTITTAAHIHWCSRRQIMHSNLFFLWCIFFLTGNQNSSIDFTYQGIKSHNKLFQIHHKMSNSTQLLSYNSVHSSSCCSVTNPLKHSCECVYSTPEVNKFIHCEFWSALVWRLWVCLYWGVYLVRSSLCFCRSFMQVHWRRDWLGFKRTSSARNMELSSPASARQRKRPMSSRSSTRPSGKNLKSSPKAALCVFVTFEGVICVRMKKKKSFIYLSQNRLEVVRFEIS